MQHSQQQQQQQPEGSAGPSLSPLKRALDTLINEEGAGEAGSPGALGSTSAKKANNREGVGAGLATQYSPIGHAPSQASQSVQAPPAAQRSLFGATAPPEPRLASQVPPPAAAELPRFVHVDVGASAHQPSQASSPGQKAAGGQAQVPPRKQRIELTPRQLEAVQRALEGENLFVTGSAGAVRV
jgi:hypothetical protein